MKVLHINTYDFGGAAGACIRLHKGLLNKGIDSKIFFLYKTKDNIQKSYSYKLPEIPSSLPGKIIRNIEIFLGKLHKILYILNRPQCFEIFSFPDSFHRIQNHALYKEADIINLHWTSRFLDYETFFKESGKKIVWTLHDMYPFTGGCHFSSGCTGFQRDCRNCHQLKGTIRPDYAYNLLKLKIESLKQICNKLHIVSPSKWLLDLSKTSKMFFSYPHYHIPNSLEKNVYKAEGKEAARKKLGLPSDKKIILFVSADTRNVRKGYGFFKKAINLLKSKNYLVCIVGGKKFRKRNIYGLGKIYKEKLMSMVYSAADVYAIPSLEDNFPGTVLESLMCGTPVIGFPAGGIKDMVVHNVNGRLCEKISSENLAEDIIYVLDNLHLFNRKNISRDAVSKYSLEVQAENYVRLYNSL